MELSFIDDFINFSHLFLVLDDFDGLQSLLALLWALVRREQAKHLAIEAQSALLLGRLSI